jgi:hypothetical protein
MWAISWGLHFMRKARWLEVFKSYLKYQYGPGIGPKFKKSERVKIQLGKTSNHLAFVMKCKPHEIAHIGLMCFQ